jgi:hypothetical protein
LAQERSPVRRKLGQTDTGLHTDAVARLLRLRGQPPLPLVHCSSLAPPPTSCSTLRQPGQRGPCWCGGPASLPLLASRQAAAPLPEAGALARRRRPLPLGCRLPDPEAPDGLSRRAGAVKAPRVHLSMSRRAQSWTSRSSEGILFLQFFSSSVLPGTEYFSSFVFFS